MNKVARTEFFQSPSFSSILNTIVAMSSTMPIETTIPGRINHAQFTWMNVSFRYSVPSTSVELRPSRIRFVIDVAMVSKVSEMWGARKSARATASESDVLNSVPLN